MSSAIDPTKPADGVAAVKRHLRDNLQAAKNEIEALQTARIPTGGLAQQVLAKVSVADFHTQWVNQTGGSDVTASNLGDGVGLFKQKAAGNLEFKSLLAGPNIAINLVEDELQIVASPSGGSSSHFIDVKNDFGAAGNGTTDDTAAIQSAINAAPSAGAIIFFPRGSYRVTSTLTIPAVATGALKAVRLEGECASMRDGTENGHAGGASRIRYEGAGTCLDAFSGGPRTSSLAPTWSGSIRNLAIHKFSGNGTVGIRANALMNAIFQNVLIRGFPKNLLVQGEYFYAVFDSLRSYHGQVDFSHDGGGSGPKANGTVFQRCIFSEYGGPGAAFIAGHIQWPGQFLKFENCWFENNENGSVDIQDANQVIFDKCYFEDQTGTATHLVRYESLPSATGIVCFDTCYARMPNNSMALVEARAGNGSSQCTVSLRDTQISTSGATGCVAVRKGSPFPTSIRITSINGIANPTESVPLFSGGLNELAELFSVNCMFAEDWSATGNKRNCIKGGWTVL
jgi:hypothetical protein